MKSTKFQPGDNVRLTGAFLRNTGQMVGGEGQSVWEVLNCDCSLCTSRHTNQFVLTNEKTPDGYRHILAANLEMTRKR